MLETTTIHWSNFWPFAIPALLGLILVGRWIKRSTSSSTRESRAVQRLIKILSNPKNDQASADAATALGQMAIADKDMAEAITQLLITAMGDSSKRDLIVRAASASALSGIGSDLATDALKTVALSVDELIGLRICAVNGLKKNVSLSKVEDLERLAYEIKANSSLEFQKAIAECIRSHVAKWCKVLIEGKDSEERVKAIELLGKSVENEISAFGALISVSNDGDDRIQSAIALALGDVSKLKVKQQQIAIAILANYLKNSKAWAVRNSAAKALGSFTESDRSVSVLLYQLPQQKVVSVIKSIVRSMRDLKAVDELLVALEFHELGVYQDVSQSFLHVLRSMKDGPDEDAMQEIATLLNRPNSESLDDEDRDAIRALIYQKKDIEESIAELVGV